MEHNVRYTYFHTGYDSELPYYWEVMQDDEPLGSNYEATEQEAKDAIKACIIEAL